ncbi:MAG: peroxidase [Ponticaulis sp.]|nr:peroxidase [Ponticaulis sp.]|tara:strand:+ start:9526 stop:10113 length:588 start_codon:yes stop_codon:yes gene_type:complete
MSVFPSLPSRANLVDLFKAHPRGAAPLMALHDALLRGDTELTQGQGELIASYVSALNTCSYCFGAHKVLAQAFGIDPDLIDAVIRDPATADISDLMKALLSYAAKVTEKASILPSDTRAILEAGGTETMIHETLMITCLYNFMNRLVDGAGLSPAKSYGAPSEDELTQKRQNTYQGWGKIEGFLTYNVNEVFPKC